MPDIVIIGGGVTGAVAAHCLARDRHRVVLIEARRIAAMASGWSLGGVRQSGRDPAELPLAKAAVALWPGLAAEIGAETEYRRRGNLRLARTEAEVAVIRRLVDDQRALGLDLTFLPDNKSVRAISPAVGPAVLAASYCPTDGHANPALTTRGFIAAARRHGADIREGVAARAIVVKGGRVAGVETSDGLLAAESVIVAAGIGTPELIAPLGLALPITVKYVTVLQSEPLPPSLDQVFGVANADCAGRQEVDGRLRMTSGVGTWQGNAWSWSEQSLAPDRGQAERLVDLVAGVLPVIREAPVHRLWGGLIDLTPDALPVIDAPASVGGLVIAAGFSGHGFGISPVTGQLAADLAVGKPPLPPINAFRLDRFATQPRAAAGLSLHG